MPVPNPVSVSDLTAVGTALNRPECVLATVDGHLCVSDWRGGVCIIRPDGSQRLVTASDGEEALRPNGIALAADGSFLLAHLGDDTGGLYRLQSDGQCRPELLEVEGMPLPPSNFPHVDAAGRTWLTVSTRHRPRAAAYRGDVRDGFIVLIDERGARIVADGLGYTNECIVHPDGAHLYVNETFSRRLSRFAIADNGTLGPRQTVTEFGHGTYPDGLAFDEQGGAWITSIVSNRVIHVSIDGEHTVVIEDTEPGRLDEIEAAFQAGEMGRPHLDQMVSTRLQNVSSLAFGGPDLETAYLGCLLGTEILSFRAPVRGWPLAHWHTRIAAPKQ